jgi:ribosome-associated protein
VSDSDKSDVDTRPTSDQPSSNQTSRTVQPSHKAQYAPGEVIDLQDYLKLVGLVDTGGEAKYLIQIGEVRLNGEVETRRRKKIRRGDTVKFGGREHIVDF